MLAGQGLPTRAGAIATFDHVARDNTVYDTDLQLIFYDEPVFGNYEGWYRRIASAPRYSDLLADLRYYRALYARIEADQRPLSWWLDEHPRLRSEPDFPAFYARFHDAVQDAATAISSAGPVLARLGG